MPIQDAHTRAARLMGIVFLLWAHPSRKWHTSEIARRFKVSVDTAERDLKELSNLGIVPLITHGAAADFTWEISPDSSPPLFPLYLDFAQGTALYAAIRLLSQQQGERNDAVRSALDQLIAVFPEPLRPHLEALASELSLKTQLHDSSFTTLSQGWLGCRVVRVTYEPAHGKAYTCRFSPYLVEPSGIGRTLYFIGHSDPPGALRTYKLERIRAAELTNDTFEVPADFDGVALLRRAWGVMYGEGDPRRIRLRFSQFVSKRVRETMWHPSQQLTDTAEGLVWEADIGDLTEIRPWIRGWGADCEVLEPKELRDELMRETRRLMRLYSLQADHNAANGLDQSLLDDLFGKD